MLNSTDFVSSHSVFIWMAIAFLLLVLGFAVLPRLRQLLHVPEKRHKMPSRAESRIGLAGTVTVALDPISSLGRVMVDDEDWAAKGSGPLPVGSKIEITGVDGILLLVRSSES